METFFTNSDKIQNIIKSFNLTKSLFVSSIIIGDAHTGKKTLAKYLFPKAYLVSAIDNKALKEALEHYDELIISDFEKFTNQSSLDFTNKRIIATANYMGNPEVIDELFAFIYMMPSLHERPDDAKYLQERFAKEALELLMLDESYLNNMPLPMNLSKNSKSLKKDIFIHLTRQTMNAKDIELLLYEYLLKNLSGNDDYRKYLSLYEKPLIEAGLKKFGSQLQLSQILGINRNTLRKKIYENNID